MTATKTTTCPVCSRPVQREVIEFGGREIFASAACLCPDCATEQDRQRAEKATVAAQTTLWLSRVPEDYHDAKEGLFRPEFKPALGFRENGHVGLGITGPAGTGKSMAVAVVTRSMPEPLRWVNGSRARQIAIDAATADGAERDDARKAWDRLRSAPLLVLDDIDKAKFTEAWADRLFELLEHRGRRLPTFWTANTAPLHLAKRIGDQCHDRNTGDAIERRLCQWSLVISI